jgi:hypothetical protein
MGDGVVHGKCGLRLGLGWDGALKGRVMYYNDMVHRVKVVQQEETSCISKMANEIPGFR